MSTPQFEGGTAAVVHIYPSYFIYEFNVACLCDHPNINLPFT